MAGRFKSKLPRSRHYIKEWRDHFGDNREDFAEKIGMSEANLSRLENFKQDYTQGILDTIASIVGCEPADLLAKDPKDGTMPFSY